MNKCFVYFLIFKHALGEELEIRFVDREYSIELPGQTAENCTLEDAYFLTTGMFYKKGDGGPL